MKKKHKINFKLAGLILAVMLVVSLIIPFTVFADGDLVFTFEVENSNEYELSTDEHHLIVTRIGTEENNYVDTISEGGANISDEITASCASKLQCTITVPEEKGSVKFRFNGSAFDLTNGNNVVNPDTVLSSSATLSVKLPSNHNQGVEPGGDYPGGDTHFDGRAVVVWSCGEGVCYHEFGNDEHGDPEIGNFDDGNSTYFKDTEIEADNKPGTTFNVDAEYKGWYLTDGFERWQDLYEMAIGHEVDWNTLDPELIIGDPMDVRRFEEAATEAGRCPRPNEEDPEGCVDEYAAEQGYVWTHKLQPLGEPEYNNCYVSYGDRNFKVVIYNDEYKGVAMGDLSRLHYYPAEWTNAFIKRDQFDISGTSKDEPTGITSILLESTVIIKALNYNNFEIASIEALDVPEDAVTVNKVNGEFELVFASNFYDNVVFKVTDTDGEVSYLQVNRYTIDGWIKFKDNHPVLNADFYFDREKSYSDFNLTAKIIYRNGTIKNVTLEAADGIDDGLGNITPGYEVDEEEGEYGPRGKGLKKSTFEYPLENGEDREIKKVYLNAEYKGSTASNYAGAYVGSGEGVLANIYQGEGE